MSTIGNLVYKIIADTKGFTAGMVGARGELRLAQQVMTVTRTQTQLVGTAIDELNKLYHKGLIDIQAYRKASEELWSQTPAAQAAKAAEAAELEKVNASIARARELTEQYLTPTQQYVERASELSTLLREGRLAQETYNAGLADAERLLPGIVEQEQKLLETIRQAKGIVDSAATAEERHAAGIEALQHAAKAGAITQNEYTRAVEKLKSQLPSVAKEERERNQLLSNARSIIDATATAEERHAVKLNTLDAAMRKNLITVQEHAKAAARLNQPVPSQPKLPMQAIAGPGVGASLAATGTRLLAPLAGALAVRNVVSEIKEDWRELSQLVDLSEKFRMPARDAQLLEYAASRSSVSVDGLDSALSKYQRTVATAIKAGVENRNVLHDLKIDADALSRLPMGQQMRTLADAIARVRNSAEQSRIAVKLFGSEGDNMLKMLRGGSAALDEFFRQREQLGPIFDDKQFKSIEDGSKAMQEASMALDLAFKNVAVSMADYVAPSAAAVLDIIDNTNLSTRYLHIGFRTLADPIGTATLAGHKLAVEVFEIGDALAKMTGNRELEQFFANSLANAKHFRQDFIANNKYIAETKRLLEEFRDKFDDPSRGDQLMSRLRNGIREVEQAQADPIEGGENIARWVKPYYDLERQLQKQIATFGMAADEAALWELRMQGATDTTLAPIVALQKQMRALHEWQDVNKKHLDLMEQGKRLMEEHRSPAQRLADEMRKLKEIYAAGGLSADAYNKEAAKLRKELESPIRTPGTQANLKGTQEAIKLLAEIRQRGAAAKPAADVVRPVRSLPLPGLGGVGVPDVASRYSLQGIFDALPKESPFNRDAIDAWNAANPPSLRDRLNREAIDSWNSPGDLFRTTAAEAALVPQEGDGEETNSLLRKIAENTAKPPLAVEQIERF